MNQNHCMIFFFYVWKDFISKSLILSTFCSTNAFLSEYNIHMKSVMLNQPVAWNQARWLKTVITHIFLNLSQYILHFGKVLKNVSFLVYSQISPFRKLINIPAEVQDHTLPQE